MGREPKHKIHLCVIYVIYTEPNCRQSFQHTYDCVHILRVCAHVRLPAIQAKAPGMLSTPSTTELHLQLCLRSNPKVSEEGGCGIFHFWYHAGAQNRFRSSRLGMYNLYYYPYFQMR